MRKIFTLFSALGMMVASSLQAADWATDLVTLNPEVIDSVKFLPAERSFYDTYLIYYHQPLLHEQPELGSLPLRALMSVYRSGGDIGTMMNQMHIDGYQLGQNLIDAPILIDSFIGLSPGELEGRYDGNLLQPEHRYFGESCPNKPWETLGYCEAKEAAADFHALIEAMKKVFKGKWAITGTSKGGAAAAIQHAFYPDDADCFVPYVAPFLFSANDSHMLDYMMTHAWTPKLREEMQHIQKEILHRPGVFKLFCGNKDLSGEELNKKRCSFLYQACVLDHGKHQYSNSNNVENDLIINRNYLESKGLDDYTDEMLAYMVIYSTFFLGVQGSDFENVYEYIVGNTRTRTSTEFQLPMSSVFAVEPERWEGRETAYFYQEMHELGYYDLNFEYFYDTKQEVDSVTALWQNTAHNLVRHKKGNIYDNVEFDPSLMQFVCQQTASTEKPMLFIYGGDDLWTGARMPEQYINNNNVREYILPGMNHDACISEVKNDDLANEIWAFLDNIFRNNDDAIEQIEQQPAGVKTRYNLMGLPTEETQGLSIENGRVIFKK